MEMGVLHAIIMMLIYLSTENVVGIMSTSRCRLFFFRIHMGRGKKDFGPSKITECSFDGNTAKEGAAIYTAAGYDMVINSSFTRNFAGSVYG